MELVYPIEENFPVRCLPEETDSPENSEIFPVIDENGLVIGRATRSMCHCGSHLLHPVVHLHIINRSEQLYLQKRSMKKDLMPGKWDTAVGGHVRYGESVIEALYRESDEELGFRDFNPISLSSYRWDSRRDAEFVNIFVAVGTYELHPDHDEVDEGRWWGLDEIDSHLRSGIFTPNFVSEYKEIRSKLLSVL